MNTLDKHQLIKWSDELKLNNVLIDNQHKTLISIINDLTYSLKEQKTPKALASILNALLDYSEYHFETENYFMDKIDLEEQKIHKRKHEEFIEKIIEFKSQHEQDNELSGGDLLEFIKDWFYKHEFTIDRECFQKQ